IANWDASLPECNPCNNANAWVNGTLCTVVGTASSTYQQTYTATCAPGYAPQWDLLAFDVTTPRTTDVKFAVQTGPSADGPWSPAAPVEVAKAAQTHPPADHPNHCSMTGPSPCGPGYPASCACPVDVGASLAPTDVQQPDLLLSVTFDATLSPPFPCP